MERLDKYVVGDVVTIADRGWVVDGFSLSTKYTVKKIDDVPDRSVIGAGHTQWLYVNNDRGCDTRISGARFKPIDRDDMATKTQAALEKSIVLWEAKAAEDDLSNVEISPGNCPLCQRFFYDGNKCAGCPIFEKSGRAWCRSTPIDAASDALYGWYAATDSINRDAAFTKFKRAAAESVDYLKSLRPAPEYSTIKLTHAISALMLGDEQIATISHQHASAVNEMLARANGGAG